MSALLMAIQALQALLSAVPLIAEVKAQYDALLVKLKGFEDNKTDPTSADWDALDAANAALRASLHSK